MDPRRFLIVAAAGLLLSGCAILRSHDGDLAVVPMTFPVPLATAEETVPAEAAPAPDERVSETAVAGAAAAATRPGPMPYRAVAPEAPGPTTAPLGGDRRMGAVQIFAWSPGRIYEVRTAPLRVTTLTLGPGETLVAKAAGDTVRWQIGEAVSGSGPGQRTHVLLKPLERGLETNLILTTNRRVYYLDLSSGTADRFNPAIAWDDPQDPDVDDALAQTLREPVRVPDPVVMPEGPLNAGYRITPQGRRPRWTPASAFNDGRRTFITFDADLQIDEAPTLFVIAPDGERQMVNYRQAGGMFIVDRVFDRAELRLGDRRPQIVRLQRLEGARP